MARKDYVYFDIPKKMAMSLDYIYKLEGRKHGIESRNELVRRILSDFIGFYEHDTFHKAIIGSKKIIDPDGKLLKEDEKERGRHTIRS